MPTLMELCSVGLRATTLAAKFCLLIVLAFYLTPAEVGEYGIFAAALAWLMYLAGADFYTFSTREVIGSSRRRAYGFLVNQFRFHLITYVPLLIVVIYIFSFGILRTTYWVPFVFLLVVEHLGLEVGRMLIALQRPILAGAILFIRGGAWCLVVAALFAFVPVSRSLDAVLSLWIAGSMTALCIGAIALFAMTKHDEKVSFDWRWIKDGLKIALPLMIGSLAVRGIFTVDRIWVEQIAGADVLGVYVFYVGIATVIITFIDAAVIDFSYPRMVLLVKNREYARYRTEFNRLTLKVVFLTAIMSIGAIIFIHLSTRFLENQIYRDYFYLVPPIVLAMAIYGVSTVAHVALYAHRYDFIIISSQVVALCSFIVTYLLMQAGADVLYLVYSLNISFLLILIIKYFWVFRLELYK